MKIAKTFLLVAVVAPLVIAAPAVAQQSQTAVNPAVAPVATPPVSSVNPMRVSATQVLARVNGKPIQLKDLVAVQPGEAEKSMTPAQYKHRLQRAIEMELTFQAAREQGVELTPAQKQRLEQIAAQPQENLEHYRKDGFTWSSSTAAQAEMERLLLTAQLLEQNLVAKKAGVIPSSQPAMQTRYEQERRALLDQLQTGASITKAVPLL